MGIDKLNKLLTTQCKWVFKSDDATKWSGTRIAIDFTKLYAIKKVAMLDATRNMTSMSPTPESVRWHLLKGVYHFVTDLLAVDITPVFILDGEPSEHKMKYTMQGRSRQKHRAQDKLAEMQHRLSEIDDLDGDQYSKGLTELSKLHYNATGFSEDDKWNVIEFMEAMGLPYVQAPSDAEEMAVQLQQAGVVSAVLSTDTDVLAFGGTMIHDCDKRWNHETKEKEITFHYVDVRDVLEGLRLTKCEFIDLCILLGCDCNKKLYYVNLDDTYEYVKEWGVIENIPHKSITKPDLEIDYCRDLFAGISFCYEGDLTELQVDVDLNRLQSTGEDFCIQLGVEDWYRRLVGLYKTMMVNRITGMVDI